MIDIDLYAEDGVNVTAGDAFSAFAARECAKTQSPFVRVADFGKGHFRGPRGFRFAGLPAEAWLDVAADGIGTKVIIITEALSHKQAARDVLAMTCGDITRWGGKPLLFSNVLDVSMLGESKSNTNRLLREAIIGLCEAARDQGVVAYRGETAELGACVGSENDDAVTKFNWAGFAIGAYHPEHIITGEWIGEGDAVVALREHGFRSNGMSSVRAAFRRHFGDTWWKNPDAESAIKAAAMPSTLFDRFLSDINGWNSPSFTPEFNIHYIAHISGGGIPGKFARDILFPRGYSAELTELWEPPAIMQQCAQWREMPDRQCYTTWNGGQGVLVVISHDDVARFSVTARAYGISAWPCGVIKDESSPRLLIHSKFGSQQKVLEYIEKDEDF